MDAKDQVFRRKDSPETSQGSEVRLTRDGLPTLKIENTQPKISYFVEGSTLGLAQRSFHCQKAGY